MNTTIQPIPVKKPSRKELQRKVKTEKALLKIERKKAFRKKTEKKLVEKAERKIFHKKENAQKKLQIKLEKKKVR
jgi:hypothetical protein